MTGKDFNTFDNYKLSLADGSELICAVKFRFETYMQVQRQTVIMLKVWGCHETVSVDYAKIKEVSIL